MKRLILVALAWCVLGAVAQGQQISGGPASNGYTILANGELLFQNNVAGVNVLKILNQSSTGFSAYSGEGADLQFSSSGTFEHFAVGYGESLSLNGSSGFNYFESSRYTGGNNANIPPSRLVIQQTGGVAQSPILINAEVTNNSTTATINTCVSCGGVWPANGSYIAPTVTATAYIPPGTTIVSGGGTGTITMSNAATGTNGFVPVTVGSPTYAQYSTVVFEEQGPIQFYSWANSATNSPVTPFWVFDRQYGRVGMNLGTAALPTNTMDIVGGISVGPDTNLTNRRTYGTYDLNVIDTGTNFLNLFKDGVDQLHVVWNATPSRIDFIEANGPTIPVSMYMDGTATTKLGGELLYGKLYSAAGTALPTCNSGNEGAIAMVSDATSPTYHAIYTSGGAVVSPVFCNGSNWLTN